VTSNTPNSPPDEFLKRTLTPRTVPHHAARSLLNVPALVRANRSDRVSPAFAERLMLATTAVNECRYCARFHAGLARQAGVDPSTVDAILERDGVAVVDDHERPALVFAQRYAETDGHPGREAIATLVDIYGPETAADLRAYVRAIHAANLLGNTVDAVGYRSRRLVGGCVGRLHRTTVGSGSSDR
jgi:AhpD family alkylhydroperoxidase